MRQQEGKCYFKPAPENTVEINTTLKGVNLAEMDQQSQANLEKEIQDTVAEAADEEPEAVNVTLTAGSVIISAVIDLEERIGIMEGEKEGQDVNLVKEMESLKGAVQKDLGKSDVKKEILTKAKNIEGVQQAAGGEITITDIETSLTASAATKAPTQAPASTTPGAPSESVQEREVDDSVGSQTTSTTPPASSESKQEEEEGEEDKAVSAAVHHNAFAAVLVGSAVAAVLQ
jgi:hypothetical protein